MKRMVKHFSITDMAYSYCFTETMEELTKIDLSSLSLCTLFYLYPAICYLDDEPFLNDEAKEVLNNNKSQIKVIYKELNKYYSLINDDSFKNDLVLLRNNDYEFVHNYIAGFEKFAAANSIISKDAFLFILENGVVPLHIVLTKKKICCAYAGPIKAYMLTISDGITYLVSEYDERKKFGNETHYYLPKDFSDKEIESMIDKYICLDDANLNIVNCLMFHKDDKDTYIISPACKVRIKEAYKRLQDRLFNQGYTVSNDYEIRMDPNQYEHIITESDGKRTLLSYGGKWVDENLNNNATILNNLIYVIELVDRNFRFTYLPAANSGSGIFDAFNNRHKDEYGDMSFDNMDPLSNVIFTVYYKYLKSKGVHLETVFEWFVNDYIKEEFNIDGFEINLPSDDGGYQVKCKNLFSEIEKLLKLYMVFQKYKSIDQAIFEEESLCKYQDIKSLNENKYIYFANDNVLRKVVHLLFSDQSMLNYIDKDLHSDNFADLIIHNEIYLSDYHEHNKNDLDFLLSNEIIALSDNGRIKFKYFKVINILKELYFKGFMDFTKFDLEFKNALNYLDSRGWVEYGNTLFSKQEADYLNYYLNNSAFTNALKLRNIYEHTGRINATEQQLYSDYIKGLKILALITIKINDEFCSLPEK